MKYKIINLFGIITLSGFSCFSCKKETVVDVPKSISIQVNSLLAYPEIEALTIGIVKQDISYKIHKGKLLDGEIPNDQTLYEIASITKTFTGTLLAKAIVDKKVKLDDDIRLYLPDEYPNLEYEDPPITFRHLVTYRG